MRVTIRTSGGFGGFGLSPKPASVDVDRLPEGLQKRCRAALSPGRLKAMAKAPGNPRAADTITYEITVADENGAEERIDLGEDKLSPELLDLIDEIRGAAD